MLPIIGAFAQDQLDQMANLQLATHCLRPRYPALYSGLIGLKPYETVYIAIKDSLRWRCSVISFDWNEAKETQVLCSLSHTLIGCH